VKNLLDSATTKHPTAIRVLKSLLSPTYYRCRRFISPLWRVGTLPWYISALLVLRRPASFKFVEIGVFKGDNAVHIINSAKRFTTSIQYVGFDLFENKDEFFELHAEDRAEYDKPEYPYWEFQSGQHSLAKVHSKLSAVLSEADFALIQGDSTITVPAHRERLTDATVIYIDGCHDYDIVSQDWQNVRSLINANPATVVAFDDVLYPGVARLKTEIEQDMDLYRVFPINKYQFFVTSKNLRWRERHLLGLAKGVVGAYLRVRG
jgi:hypothetical protein